MDAFQSEKYLQLLQTMRKMHNYSLINKLLLFSQKEDVSMCLGFTKWKDLGYVPRRGEHGLKVIAPIFIKQEKEEMKEDGTIEKITEDKQLYKVAFTFDVSQVVNIKTGEPYPSFVTDLKDPVAEYYSYLTAVEAVSPVPIRYEEIKGGVHGYYATAGHEIVIRNDMPELQTLKTLVHEITHARTYNYLKNMEVDRSTHEIIAESCAYIICTELNLSPSVGEYSFPYLCSWSNGKDIKELKASLDIIEKESMSMIDDIKQNLQLTLHQNMTIDQPKMDTHKIKMAI